MEKYYKVSTDGTNKNTITYRYDDIPKDLPMTPKVKAIYDKQIANAQAMHMGGLFRGMTVDDVRSVYAAFIRKDVGFSGGRFTRLPTKWRPNKWKSA